FSRERRTRPAARPARSVWLPSSSAAPPTASASSCRSASASTTARARESPSPGPAAATMRRSISTDSSASTRGSRRSSRCGRRGSSQSSTPADRPSARDRVLNGTAGEAFDAIRMLQATDVSRYRPAHGAEYPRNPFGQALRQIAQLTKADVGLEIAFAEIGGWDTHINQGSIRGQLANRLDDFGRAIAALVADLGDLMEDTVVLTMSEFGRAVSENGGGGTDHGHGNVMLAIGGGVRG